MSITNELRKYAGDFYLFRYKDVREKLDAIADRIDAEHEKAILELNNLADAIADTCVQLPKDANGEYIRIGDMMENLREDFEPPFHHTFRVYGIQYREYNQECTLTEDGYPSIQYRASEVRHHHEPTVEDVLREFGEKYCDTIDGCAEESELFAEYAAKLQLRSEDE